MHDLFQIFIYQIFKSTKNYLIFLKQTNKQKTQLSWEACTREADEPLDIWDQGYIEKPISKPKKTNS